MFDRLATTILDYPGLVIAISGGVDSMTLATFAHRLDPKVSMIHAVSPAVPPAATARVEEMAQHQGWRLQLIGSGEFDDVRYRNNPADRCYFCKSNLYDRIRGITKAPIASGTNRDDLGDYRPGLLAASERSVVHPFVIAEMDKKAVRSLARQLGLDEVAELPAQPCLASRVETGIAIAADDLAFIDRVEIAIRDLVAENSEVRCRVTHRGIEIELGVSAISERNSLTKIVSDMCEFSGRGFAGIVPYRKGGMFLR